MWERGAPLPGNDKENWGNHHTGLWRIRGEEGGRRQRIGRKGKEEKRKKLRRRSMVMINLNQAKLMNVARSRKTGVKLKHEEEWEEKGWRRNWRIGKEITGSEMEEEKMNKTQQHEKCQQVVKGNWGNCHIVVIGIWRGRKSEEGKGGKKKKW